MSLAFFDISSWPYEDKAIDQAYGEKQHRPASSSSRKTYDIDKFVQLTTSASMASPAPHVAFQLTNAKVRASAQYLLVDYEPLPGVQPIAVAYKGKGKGPAKKRKRDDADDDELNFSDLEDEEFADCDKPEDSHYVPD